MAVKSRAFSLAEKRTIFSVELAGSNRLQTVCTDFDGHRVTEIDDCETEIADEFKKGRKAAIDIFHDLV